MQYEMSSSCSGLGVRSSGPDLDHTTAFVYIWLSLLPPSIFALFDCSLFELWFRSVGNSLLIWCYLLRCGEKLKHLQ